MNRALSLVAWLMAALFVAGAFMANRADAQGKPASADAGITAQVQGALKKDPFLRNMDINVETNGAVVNLTGFVRSVDDIVKAGELARAVRGVEGVRNGLRIANRPSRA